MKNSLLIALKCNILLWSMIGVALISSCYYDGAKVTMSQEAVRNGECVTNAYNNYETMPYDVLAQGKIGPLHSEGFPQNSVLPKYSPVCMAVTITNTNHGKNSNNIVVVGNGLQVEYVLDGVAYDQQIYDPKASDINITRASQTAGIISVFDPDNCVTTQGKHVKLLSDNYHSCKFYLQITDSGYHQISNNTINLKLFYSNGDQLYTAYDSLKYQSSFFIGGKFKDSNYNISTLSDLEGKIFQWHPNQNQDPVLDIVTDDIGSLFVLKMNKLEVYRDNKRVKELDLPGNINHLVSDHKGDIYMTDGKVVYMTNLSMLDQASSIVVLAPIIDAPVKISSMQVFNKKLYVVINETQFYVLNSDNINVSWRLVLDTAGLNIKQKSISAFYLIDEQHLKFAVHADNQSLYGYDVDKKELSITSVNTSNTSSFINNIFMVKDHEYLLFNTAPISEEDDSLLYHKIKLFDPVDSISADKINGVMLFKNKLCLFGENLMGHIVKARNVSNNLDSSIADELPNNFICVTDDDKEITSVAHTEGEVTAVSGLGLFDQ